MNHGDSFSQFVQTISKLRDPEEGCPWDLKQTHLSLINYLIEETFEAVDAIKDGDLNRIKDELGDILLQVVLHSVIASEKEHFSIDDVISNINEKMIRRHPHVFSSKTVESIEEVKMNWEKIKKQENKNQNTDHTFNKEILSNTALLSADKIGKKTQKHNFDWNNEHEVFEKVLEELNELKTEMIIDKNEAKKEEEFGDLLFSMVQLGRHLKLNPEIALREANKKFINRYSQMEDNATKSNKNFSKMSRQEKELAWKEVKEFQKSE
jgi:MazG family protein